MAEELEKEEPKKEEPKKEEPKKEEPKKEEPKKEEPKQAPPKKEEKKKPVIVEKTANCMKCNKRLQRKTWYYRANGYYCSKRCWRLALQEAAEKKQKEENKK